MFQSTEDPVSNAGRAPVALGRRRFICLGIAAAGLFAGPALAAGGEHGVRKLSFHNLHTDEDLDIAYRRNGRYLPQACERIDWLLRDFRTGGVYKMDRGLLDLLWRLHAATGSRRRFQVISGYRSPKTNAWLRAHTRGVAKRSLHMAGKAIDIRLDDVDLADLHAAAVSLRLGGVGYYPKSDFVHVDVGRVRYWHGPR